MMVFWGISINFIKAGKNLFFNHINKVIQISNYSLQVL